MEPSASLFDWYYRGLGGVGGWVVFAGGGLSAAVWLLSDSGRRSLPARFERAKIVVVQILSVPAVLLRLLSGGAAPVQHIYFPYEVVFYLGLLGGVIPATVVAWYAFVYHDKVACKHGHPPYSRQLARCPRCLLEDMATGHGPTAAQIEDPQIRVHAQRLHNQLSGGWLITSRGQRYPLFAGENLLGRGPDMHFQFVGDQAVSRNHVRITEREGFYFVMDCGSSGGTRLNDHPLTPYVEEPLRSGDVVELSEFTRVRLLLPAEATA